MDTPTTAPPVPTAPTDLPAWTLSPLSKDGTAWTWRPREDFGPWLRELRETTHEALRDAAKALDVSFTVLQKLETGGRAKAPTIELLTRIASHFGKDLDLVLTRAGYKMEVPEDLRDAVLCDEGFLALALHPALRPSCMDERWAEAFSRIQKAQWLEFARNLEAHIKAGGAPVEEILREFRRGRRKAQK